MANPLYDKKFLKQLDYSNEREREEAGGVSIIIPSKDNPLVLRRCLQSIQKWTLDIPYEVIVKLAKFYDTSVDYILFLTNEKKAYKKD